MSEPEADDIPIEEPADLALRNEIAEKVIALLFHLRPQQHEMAGHAWALDAACLVVARAVLAANGHLENDPKDLLNDAFENIKARVEARRSQYFAQKISMSQAKTGVM
jgi:ribosomal protein S7